MADEKKLKYLKKYRSLSSLFRAKLAPRNNFIYVQQQPRRKQLCQYVLACGKDDNKSSNILKGGFSRQRCQVLEQGIESTRAIL